MLKSLAVRHGVGASRGTSRDITQRQNKEACNTTKLITTADKWLVLTEEAWFQLLTAALHSGIVSVILAVQ